MLLFPFLSREVREMGWALEKGGAVVWGKWATEVGGGVFDSPSSGSMLTVRTPQAREQTLPQSRRPSRHGSRLLQSHRALRESSQVVRQQQPDEVVRQGLLPQGRHVSSRHQRKSPSPSSFPLFPSPSPSVILLYPVTPS